MADDTIGRMNFCHCTCHKNPAVTPLWCVREGREGKCNVAGAAIWLPLSDSKCVPMGLPFPDPGDTLITSHNEATDGAPASYK